MSAIRQNFTDNAENAILKHIGLEFFTGYQYTAMSIYYARDDLSFPGVFSYFEKLGCRYFERAKKWLSYVNNRGGRVEFKDIPRPETNTWGTPLDGFQKCLEMEKTVFQSLLDLHKISVDTHDAHLSHYVEDEYLDESTNRMKDVADKISQLKRVNSGLGDFVFDLKLFKCYGRMGDYYFGHKDETPTLTVPPVSDQSVDVGQMRRNIDLDKILENLNLENITETLWGFK